MIKNFKAFPYEMTRGSEEFKNFITSPFNHLFLNGFDENFGIFDNWKYKDLINWVRYTNDDGVIIEFYPNNYIIKLNNFEYRLPTPKTINEFIIDMYRLNITLIWHEKMYFKFDAKDFLCKDDIRKYYEQLLEIMNKSYELI